MPSIPPTSCPLAASFSCSSLISLADRPGSGRPGGNAVVDPVPAYGALREVDEGFPEQALRPVGLQDFRILPRTGEEGLDPAPPVSRRGRPGPYAVGECPAGDGGRDAESGAGVAMSVNQGAGARAASSAGPGSVVESVGLFFG